MDYLSIVTKDQIDKLLTKAQSDQRKRAIIPLTKDEYTGPQVAVSLILPGSYVRIHKHPKGAEQWFGLQGRILVPTYDDEGNLLDCRVVAGLESALSGTQWNYAVPQGRFHGAFALHPYALTMHVSPGPHVFAEDKVDAPFAPKEGYNNGIIENSALDYNNARRADLESYAAALQGYNSHAIQTAAIGQ